MQEGFPTGIPLPKLRESSFEVSKETQPKGKPNAEIDTYEENPTVIFNAHFNERQPTFTRRAKIIQKQHFKQ